MPAQPRPFEPRRRTSSSGSSGLVMDNGYPRMSGNDFDRDSELWGVHLGDIPILRADELARGYQVGRPSLTIIFSFLIESYHNRLSFRIQ